jgi:hypothetical protein
MKKKVKKMINGVVEYEEATVSIFFEPEHIACQYCPLLTESPRYQCRRTGDYLTDIRFTVGRWCPLEFKDGNREMEGH